ncbi:MAG TPA: O-antigen ligase family protein [Sphingobacteriaceae bacterium]
MFKKIAVTTLMIFYMYTLTFDIFLNQIFRAPTPLVFGFPLIFLFGKLRNQKLLYGWQLLWLFLACFLYYLWGQEDIKSFIVNVMTITTCGLYFNFFVGHNESRFNRSVLALMILLLISSVIMVLNHMYPVQINALRSLLIGGPIKQSPAGITDSIFNFGYHLAALTPFIYLFSLKYRFPVLAQLLILGSCLVFIYLGMQRSVLVTFFAALILFLVFYYRGRAVFLFGTIGVLGFVLMSFVDFKDPSQSKYDNIFAKNERNAEKGEDRGNLVKENLRIYADHPYGLVFYGKSWADVTRGSFVLRNGLTSHNAYLMFLTYLGPFIGFLLLFAIYRQVFVAFKSAITDIRGPSQAMLVCLCFSFLSISMNSLFHNGWILNSGATIFLYFAVLHFHQMHQAHARD